MKKQWLIYYYQLRRKPATKEGMENPYGDREGMSMILENIVAVVLACNNYEIRFGVMVTRANYSSCNRTQCRYHWFKGLITPSLDEIIWQRIRQTEHIQS
jgi:hypothetical protein